MTGWIYVISGPSGVGKSTMIRELRSQCEGLGYSVSHTTRSPRADETNGINYHFVDTDIFQKMIHNGAFVEWAKVYDEYYGTSFSGLREQSDQGLDVILDIDSQGAKNIKNHFRESVLIYVLPPSITVLQKRLKERATDDAKTIHARFQKAAKELQNCVWYDYIILNDDLIKAVDELKSIIISHRCRTDRMRPKIKDIIGDKTKS
ncbi:MAG: guanylate kinase [Deltaproteobacteria bacterium]|nr:guanylate kinase [Deltaproteobacteria bacterium]